MSLINLIILSLYFLSSYVNGQCTDAPVVDSQYLCTSPVTLTPASTGFNKWPAAGTQDMIIAFTAQITSLCSLSASTVVNFMTMSIKVGGVDKQIFRFVYNPTSPQLAIYSEDAAGQYLFLNQALPAPLAVGDWVEFVGIAFMGTNTMRCSLASSGALRIGSIYTKDYTGFLIDSSTKFTWCSNLGGSSPFSCVIKNFRVFYGQIGTARYFLGGIDAQLIGDFRLDEGTGTSLTNSVDSPLGQGYFGNSLLSPTPSTVPTWSTTDIAVKFSTTSQFITFPLFNLVPGNQVSAFKFSFQFYLKIDTAPASMGQIIGIGASSGTPKLSIVLDNNLMIGYTVLGTSQFSGTTGTFPNLNLATWQQFTVVFQLRADLQTILVDFYINTVPSTYGQGQYTLSTPGALTFANTDKIHFGGNSKSFLGQIASLRIMSPGALPLPLLSCNPGSISDMGLMSPPLPGTCSAPYVLMGSQCIECNSGYYARPVPQPNSCPACVSPCVTCTSATTCSSCLPNYSFNNSTNTCTNCTPGTYSAGGTASNCTNCPQLCTTCTAAQTCQTCQPNAYLLASTCQQCPNGTYSTGGNNTSCPNCLSPCATCTSNTSCSSCLPNYTFDNLTNTCTSCAAGTYSEGGNVSNCTNCPQLCETCTSAQTCQTCQPNSFLFFSYCIECPSGTYSTGGNSTTCTACVSPCANCTSATTCSSCLPNYSFDNLTSTCTSCAAGTYSDGGTESNCTNCPQLCTTCTAAQTCQTCQPNAYLLASTCQQCPNGTYSAGGNSTSCPNCLSPCATCTSNTSCSSCLPNYTFDNLTSTCTSCAAGTYSEGGNVSNCTNCPLLCETCTSAQTCQTCQPNSFLFFSYCIECPSGTYSPGGNSTSCIACPSPCANCTSATTCSSCLPNYSFDNLTSTCTSCAAGTYSNGGTESNCTGCPQYCDTCTSAQVCQSCLQNAFLFFSYCIECPSGTFSTGGISPSCTACVSPCANCTSATTCSSCLPNYSFDNLTNTCTSCTPGSYSAGGTASNCTVCPQYCDTCTSGQACQTCLPNAYLLSSSCIACPSGTYSTGGLSASCPNCPSPCATCTSATTCSSCLLNYFFDTLTNTCTSCAPGTYSAGGTVSSCTNCPQLCTTCSSAQVCQTCQSGAFLSSSSCMQCPIGTYSAGGTSNSCTSCPASCAACTSADVCQSCNGNYYLQGSTCLSCPNGTYTPSFNTKTSCAVGGVGAINPAIASSVANALSWLICIHSSFSIANGLISRLINTIRFINVGYSLELQVVFKSWNTDLISINIPDSIDGKVVSRDIPILYTQYGLEPNFLSNFWGQLIIIIQLFIILVILKALKLYTKKYWSNSKKMDKVMNLLIASICNAFITAMYVGLDEIAFYSVLEMRSVLFESGWSFISFITSVIFLILGICLLTVHLWILLKCHKIKSQRNLTPAESSAQAEKFLSKFKNFAILFEDFQDSSLPRHGFLLILVSRNILICLMISTGLSAYPLVQSIVLCYSSCLMLVFLVTMNPFENHLPWAVQVYLEVCVLVVNTCVLLYANLDMSDMDSTDYRNQLGAVIMVMNLCLNIGSIAFLFFNVLTTLYKVLRKWLRMRRRSSKIEVERVPQQLEQGRQSAKHPEQNLKQKNYLLNKSTDFSVDSSDRTKYKWPMRLDGDKPIRNKRHLFPIYLPQYSPINSVNSNQPSDSSRLFSPPSKSIFHLNTFKEGDVTTPPSKSLAQFNNFKESEVSNISTIFNLNQDTPPRPQSTQKLIQAIEPKSRFFF